VSGGNRGQLADFLRSRRARLTPADVGLPGDSEPGRRRTPGLRREEVAELSGVGVTWYTWLEQGRKITASPQVVDALARALRLSADEHRHLRELAGLATAPATSGDDLQARLQRLVDAATPNAASVYDVHFDYLAWNESYRRIRHDPAGLPAGRRNLLWMMFTDADNHARMTTWDQAARALLSQFRVAAGRHPGDPRFAELTAALTEASPQFRDWWAQYPVRYFRPARIRIRHPQAGRITLELFQLRLEDDPGLVMVTQVPADPASRDRVAALLAGRRLGQVGVTRRPARRFSSWWAACPPPARARWPAPWLARPVSPSSASTGSSRPSSIRPAQASHCVSRWGPSGTRSLRRGRGAARARRQRGGRVRQPARRDQGRLARHRG
jgi:transcriptional regulator with XRE-family HTH domain